MPNNPYAMTKDLFHTVLHPLLPYYGESEAHAIARYLLEVRFGMTQTDICMGKDKQISAEERRELENIIGRLTQKEPIQYILGQADFFGRTFFVSRDVLIPRPETEELIQWILYEQKGLASPRVLDIGTGSGCIAVTLDKEMETSEVTALDISNGALAIAKKNAAAHHADISFLQQDFLQDGTGTVTGPWDIIVSNPPYICQTEQTEMDDNVLQYEPHSALFVPDKHPLLFYEAIGKYALKELKPQGCLYVEINRRYGNETMNLFRRIGLRDIELKKDLCGNDRMIRCRK